MTKSLIAACTRTACFGFLAVASIRVSCAQSSNRADAFLNQNYQQLMRALPPPRREQLRKAERAWLEFAARNREALRVAAPRIGVPAERYREFEEDDLNDRVRQLSSMLRPDPAEEAESAGKMRQMDEQLNVVYQRCLGVVAPDDALKLRAAQRAWITFRDENRGFGSAVLLQITAYRITQLNNFYIKAGQYNVFPTPPPEPPPPSADKADPTVPDPFERAR